MASKQKYAMPLDDDMEDDDYQYNNDEEIDDENFSDEDEQNQRDYQNDEDGVEDIEETDNQYEEPLMEHQASERAAPLNQQPKAYQQQ